MHDDSKGMSAMDQNRMVSDVHPEERQNFSNDTLEQKKKKGSQFSGVIM